MIYQVVLSFASSLYAVAAAATCQLTFTTMIDHSENGICHSNHIQKSPYILWTSECIIRVYFKQR